MKCDINLIRKILQYAEEMPPGVSFDFSGMPGDDPKKISYHVELCIQAGFLSPSITGSDWSTGLTWQGHDTLAKLNKGCGIESIADCTP